MTGMTFPDSIHLRMTHHQTVYRPPHQPGLSELSIARALDGNRTDLALAAFPGEFSDAAEQVVNEDECPVCLDAPNILCHTRCCRKAFCLGCLAKSVARDRRCPWCRTDCQLQDTVVVSAKPEVSLDGHSIVSSMLQSLVTGFTDNRILVISEEADFRVIAGMIPSATIVASGGPRRIKESIDAFRRGRARVLLSDRNLCKGGCINLAGVTHVIFAAPVSDREAHKCLSFTGVYSHHADRPAALWGRRLSVLSLVSIADTVL